MSLDINEGHLKKLESGKNCQFKCHEVGSGVDVSHLLPKKVLTKLNRAVRNGKGFRLSPVDGGSILSTLKKWGHKIGMSNGDMKSIAKFVKPVLRTASSTAKNILQMGTQKLADKAEGQVMGMGVRSSIKKALKISDGDLNNIEKFTKPMTRKLKSTTTTVVNHLLDRAEKKATGGAVNPYLPAKNGGGLSSSSVYNDNSHVLRPNQSQFYAPQPPRPYGLGNHNVIDLRGGAGFRQN